MERNCGFLILVLFMEIISLNVVIQANELSSFDPFMDSNLFFINWAGPLDLTNDEIALLGERRVVITTNYQEKYQCILPKEKAVDEGDEKSYTGNTPDELLKPLMTSSHCSYRIESYWTYELCHGKHLKQYHETKEQGAPPKVQEYYLGHGNHWEDLSEDELSALRDPSTPLPLRDVDGVELPYLEVIMDGGTKCDLTGKPRKAHVLYVCHAEGRGEVYELKESSTCEYEVVVLTSTLCAHPRYRPKTPPVSEIRCHSMPGAALKPKELYRINMETNQLQAAAQRQARVVRRNPNRAVEEDLDEANPIEEDEDEPSDSTDTNRQPETPTPTRQPSTTTPTPGPKVGHITDKQTLREFLSGRHCLTGGTGWWKHEVCFGRRLKQFHLEKRTGMETRVYLGNWNKEKHLAWLRDNPVKRPKAPAERTWLAYYYSDGDICDLTNKPRTSELRLKCIQNVKNPHAILVSLQESVPCQYILTVESALFCPILKEADENGIISPTPPKSSPNSIDVANPLEVDPLQDSTPQRDFGFHPPKRQPMVAKIGTHMDKATLKAFLTGKYCLKGGTGWWRHEFCLRRYVKQYHLDTKTRSETNIFLGYWDEKKHLSWLQENPDKRPPSDKSLVSLLYSDGHLCELTNQPRRTEVKLKCIKSHPHKVLISLKEPQPCHYELTVESLQLCPVLEMADDDGILNEEDMYFLT